MFAELPQKAIVALSLLLLTAITEAIPARDFNIKSRAAPFDYTNGKVRGVNLGGWLVLEPWITPSIFDEVGDDAVDEWTLSQILGKDMAKARLSQHWSSFVTQKDFTQIAQAGMNHVRIPVGYWAVIPSDTEPYVNGQLGYLDQAIAWAQSSGLRVIIDLHGAPGSQNGFDNSGRRGPIEWQKRDTVDRTLDAIDGLLDRYAEYADVVLLEALNEPFVPGGVDKGGLTQYYSDVWGKLQVQNPDITLVLHDGFNPVDSWNKFITDGNVMMDNHHYQVFDNGKLAKNVDAHIKDICAHGAELQRSEKWTIVAEWSGARTDCAKYLNGKGLGSRYDGTKSADFKVGDCAGKSVGTVAALPEGEKTNIRRYIESQLDAWEENNGWVFWTWKTEGAPEWDMQQLLAEGVFPNPPTERQYPRQC